MTTQEDAWEEVYERLLLMRMVSWMAKQDVDFTVPRWQHVIYNKVMNSNLNIEAKTMEYQRLLYRQQPRRV